MNYAEYQENVKTLKRMSHAYYNGDVPIATDNEYDVLFHEVKAYEQENPEQIDMLSPTQTVGSVITEKAQKREHRKPMYSLEDIFAEEEWMEWASKFPADTLYYMEPKYDGASASLVYENGNLVSMTTRGDGKQGEDITANAPHLLGVPLVVDYRELVEIRGEIVILHEDFEAINEWRVENGKSKFLNQRNAASGGLRSFENVKDYRLRFIPYSLGENELDFETQQGEAVWFTMQGFENYGSNDYSIVGDATMMYEAFRTMEKNRSKFRMLLDGAVIKILSKEKQHELGETNHHPRYSVALKFNAEEKTTKLIKVIEQTGKTGAITPVAVIEPVNIGGVTIERVTLHNYSVVKELGLMIGDSIGVIRSGDVIPKITSVFKERRDGTEEAILEPKCCPVCKSSDLDKTQTVIKCNNVFCSAQTKGRIVYAAGRKALDIDSLGESTISELVEKEMISNLVDLFNLEYQDFLGLEGFKEKKALKVHSAIQGVKGVISAERLLNAIDINQIGQSASQKIVEHHGERTFGVGENALSYDELMAVQDIGDESAMAFVSFMEENGAYVDELVCIVNPQFTEKVELGKVFEGKTVVITGTLSKSRGEFKILAEGHGAKVSGSISKKTDFLLVGENAGGKKTKAESLGVSIIDEETFLEMIA